MLKIRPLNRDSLSDEDAPVLRKELQEEIALEMYNKALRLFAKEKFEDAIDLLFKLINENIPQLESQGGLPKSMSNLKYSSYLNIGNIYLAQNQNNEALDNYLLACELDETDVTLWYKIGKLALKENRFRQSIYAFSKGLDCNESHWPCLDEIISLLFAVRDTIGCLYYIGKALMLDSDYTKGLVFRKQIYKDNPATKEYYQKLNPDYIWEPPLDINVDESDEMKYLEEVQKIIVQINDVEKELESKPLSVIPLPKAIENYSWLSVSKSIISLYQYIQTNKMSFLTFIDMNKCMSQIQEDEITDMEVEEEKPTEIKEDIQENPEQLKPEEKLENDPLAAERRLSQNSEENGTPIQTDNDEEQAAEQETEEQEKSKPKGFKRKRDLLLDLRVWGWHSKRKHVRKSKPEKFYTVEDCLNQTLPPHLLQNKVGDMYSQDDSMNTMDIYNIFLEDRHVNILSPIHSPKSSEFESYFGTDREKEDVIQFWTKSREYCDTCLLVKEFIFKISTLWKIKWPKELISQYITIYEMHREFQELPGLYNAENIFEDVRDETLATLLYAELVLFNCPKNMEKGRILHIGQIQFIETMTTLWETNFGNDYVFIFSRIIWLQAYIYRKEGSNESAVRCLELIDEILKDEENKNEEKFCLFLPNSNKCSLISIEVTTKMLKHLEMIKSISCLEELYNQEKYKEVAEIIKATFVSNSGCPTFGKVGRPAQLGMLLHALWFTDFDDCFVWSEDCLFEAHAYYTRPGPDRLRWEKVVEKCLGIMHEIIKHKSRAVVGLLSDNKKARLTETLAKIICKQINTENATSIPLNTIIPWILLHHILAKNEETESLEKKSKEIKDNEDEEEVIPLSLSILFSAHEFLGPKSWCLTNHGELLHFILDVLLDKEDVYRYEKLREKLDIQIEQALFCLYQHPSKKNKISRHLADHNVDPLSLTWEKSFQLYEFYAPEVLPEFNSFKNASITMDMEQLLLRITALVIPECDPSVLIPKINDYFQGKTDKIPDPIQFPNKIRAIYYLLGDYYFKLRDFVRCVKYFLMDLAINPQRVDSWACLGLSYFSQLEIKLNFCKKIKNEEEFLEKAKYAQVGFTTALKLSPNDITLWIEFGTFEYMAHSFCSRYLKFESENMSMERFEYLETQKNTFLDSSGQSFKKAIALYEINENEPDERWLQYYVLGKIAEKKQAEPNEYLNYYLTATKLLHENKAVYPDKISYNSPQHLSVEALELHYRVNASILKYLELREGKDIHHSKGTLFKKTLDDLSINKKLAEQKAKKKLEKSNQVKINSEEQKNVPTNSENKTDIIVNDKDKEVENKDTNDITETVLEIQEVPEIAKEIDIEMEKEIKESVENILQKVDEMEKEELPVVQIVDEVILVDAEYDVIMILSSDEDDDNGKQEDSKPQKTSNEELKIVSEEKKIENDIEISEVNDNFMEISQTERVESGVDVQKVLDEMMQETMQIVSEQQIEMDSDTSILGKDIEVIDCSAIDINGDSKKIESDIEKNENTDNGDKKTTEESSTSSSSSGSSDSSSSSDSDSDDESSSSSSSSSSEDSSNENLSNGEILHLVDRCIKGLEQCIIRLPKNYKAIYRLVHLFFNYKNKKDLNKCKQLLLSEYKCYENTEITGLFADKKATNFFNGIWRIPSSEIDRPGSLAAHMSRCLTILLQILRATNDCKILLDLFFQLKKNPDPDKVYIKDSERIQFSEQAISLCIQTFRNNMKDIDKMNNTSIRKLLHDIHRAYVRVQKHAPEKEPQFSQMLIEVYKSFIKEKIPDNVNVLDLAIKFCQQTKIIEKQKSVVQNPSPQNPLVPMGPVLPSPSNVNIGNTSLKRPSLSGRPRGRPPLPKVPSQPKISRGKSPNSNTNWKKSTSDPIIPYDYIKHYQDELMKQYNQNMSYMQMAQLMQMYTNPSSYANTLLQAQQNANLLNQLSGLGMTGIMDKNMSLQLDKYKEMLALTKKTTNLSNFSIDQLMASTSSSKSSNKKTTTPISSSKTSHTQDKSKVTKSDKGSIDLKSSTESIKKYNTNIPTKTNQSKLNPNTIQNVSVPKEKKEPSSSVSSVSIIPREKSHSKLSASISKVHKPEIFHSKSSNSVAPLSNIIMPPPSPLMPPPSSPLSICSLSPSGSSPSTKLPSPQKSPSPISIKEHTSTIPKLNIEAMISRVSPPNHETFKKYTKDRNTPPVHSQISGYPQEVSLSRFSPSLSMTPVKTIVEPQKSVSLSKLPKTDSYISKLPSSITLTPSTTKIGPTIKHSSSVIEHSVNKSVQPTIPKKHSSSIPKLSQQQTNFPKLPSGIEIQSRNVSVDYQKPTNRKTESSSISFNIESMLQTTKPQVTPSISSSNVGYSYSQPSTQKVAHTSVITSTNKVISSGYTSHPPITMGGRNTSKTTYSEAKNVPSTSHSSTSKSKTGPRISSELYQDLQHQLSSMYTTTTKSTKGSPTSVISTVPRTSQTNFIQPQVPTSPGKTLQEKLADKKREQANKQRIELFKSNEQQSHKTFSNPHSISKMLSFSSGEVEISKVPSVNKRLPKQSTTQRRKSSSDESVICID